MEVNSIHSISSEDDNSTNNQMYFETCLLVKDLTYCYFYPKRMLFGDQSYLPSDRYVSIWFN